MLNEGLFLWMETLPVSIAFAESMLMYPLVLGVHVIALALSVGILALVDLRMAGVLLRKHDWRDFMSQLRPWFVLSFVLILATGVLLFLPMASHFADSSVFWVKMLLILLAGFNAFAFEWINRREQRDLSLASDGTVVPATPVSLRIFALVSLTLWISVIALGRVLAYI